MGAKPVQCSTQLLTFLYCDYSQAIDDLPRRFGWNCEARWVPRGSFDAIFAMMGWSLQSVWAKQLMLCEGKVLKLIRLRQGIL